MSNFLVRYLLAFILATLLFAIIPATTVLLKKNRKGSVAAIMVEVPQIKKNRECINRHQNINKIPKLESIGSQGLISIKTPVFDPVLKNEDKCLGAINDVKVYNEDEVEEVAKPLKRSAPNYPTGAKRAGLTGSVKVRFTITATGHVTNIRVVESPNDLFTKEVKRTLSEWFFVPAKIANVAVAQEGKISFSFGLE